MILALSLRECYRMASRCISAAVSIALLVLLLCSFSHSLVPGLKQGSWNDLRDDVLTLNIQTSRLVLEMQDDLFAWEDTACNVATPDAPECVPCDYTGFISGIEATTQ